MKITKTLMATTALTVAATGAFAEAHGNMADSMTLVSWGGAYQSSQQKAYVEPYVAANEGVSATWDESSAEAVAQAARHERSGQCHMGSG